MPHSFSDLAQKDKRKELLSEAHAAKQRYMEAYTSAMRVSLASPLRVPIYTRSYPSLSTLLVLVCFRTSTFAHHDGGGIESSLMMTIMHSTMHHGGLHETIALQDNNGDNSSLHKIDNELRKEEKAITDAINSEKEASVRSLLSSQSRTLKRIYQHAHNDAHKCTHAHTYQKLPRLHADAESGGVLAQTKSILEEARKATIDGMGQITYQSRDACLWVRSVPSPALLAPPAQAPLAQAAAAFCFLCHQDLR
jgi:hypothetical protein